MYALKGTKFKESFTCDYDVKNNIYSIKGKINATDFETIKLNMLKSSKAESTVDTVTANIDTFNTVSLATINTQKTADELKADAYYKIIEDRNEKYGKAKVAESEGVKYIDGLAVVDLVDFDGDDNEELLLVYRKMVKENATNAYSGERIIIENPTYCIEVYSWNGTVASKVFSNDNVSNYMNKSTVNYVMLKNNSNSVDICTNTYSYTNENNYTASTKIFSYKDGSFESTFSAREEDSYGYKSYYLDGTYSYRSDFESQAYQVPKFLNDDESYDDSKYTLIYLSGINSDEYDSTINHTVKTIGDLNKSYSADD
jgi:hypothetical protein